MQWKALVKALNISKKFNSILILIFNSTYTKYKMGIAAYACSEGWAEMLINRFSIETLCKLFLFTETVTCESKNNFEQ